MSIAWPFLPLVAFAFAPDGMAVAAGGWDHSTTMKVVPGGWEQIQKGRLQIWDVQTGKAIDCVAAHEREVTAVTFSPSGGLSATASRDGTVKFWDLRECVVQ